MMNIINELILNWWPLITLFIFMGAIIYIYFTRELE